MMHYVLSEEADADILQILTASIRQWGLARSETYILDLHVAFENLAAFPDIGREVGHLRAGYFRFPHERHNVFYQKTDYGILIIRVLHQKQPPEHHP
jgi:toxin ParE1/3/4